MQQKTFYIETFGCQMNVADSELVATILENTGYEQKQNINDADLILINTCSIRENAENKILHKLESFKSLKKQNKNLAIGIIGCMAERLKEKLFENNLVNIVLGPDAYRSIPNILANLSNERQQINIALSTDEVYEGIEAKHSQTSNISAFIPIMRGCNNFCAYCVVPYTRGRERSRSNISIMKEVEKLIKNNYKEIILLGQNVNSYLDNKFNFTQLLSTIAQNFPEIRLRFTTSHPKDISVELIETIAKYPNIARSLHLPLQSGSDRILQKMNRNYTIENYLNKINKIKELIPDCTFSTDIIAGFCSETEEDHQATLLAMQEVKYFYAFMFKYSERDNTMAAQKYKDDVADEIKTRRLSEIIELQQQISKELNKQDVDKTFEVLIEGISKKDANKLFGRSSQNKVVVFPANICKIGDFVKVKIDRYTSATLMGELC